MLSMMLFCYQWNIYKHDIAHQWVNLQYYMVTCITTRHVAKLNTAQSGWFCNNIMSHKHIIQAALCTYLDVMVSSIKIQAIIGLIMIL